MKLFNVYTHKDSVMFPSPSIKFYPASARLQDQDQDAGFVMVDESDW